MKKPIIGLTPYHDVKSNDTIMRPTYPAAIKAAGGIAVTLPLEVSEEDLAQIVDTMDGFIFTGGQDIHPFLYGEGTYIKCGEIDEKRDAMELALLPLVMKARKPILGICRGIQTLNVGLGGTLYQDVPGQFSREYTLLHQQSFPYYTQTHTVNIMPDTKMAEICGESVIRVNSMHHQAVKDPAPGCIVCGVATDGLIEAIEMPGYPYLVGVQWHPEHLWSHDQAAANLFRSFVEATGRLRSCGFR